MGCGRLGPVGSGRLKGRIPDLLGCGAGAESGFKTVWPTCRVGVGASKEGSSSCDPRSLTGCSGLSSEKLCGCRIVYGCVCAADVGDQH